jgi:ribosome biogenesis GTPase A
MFLDTPGILWPKIHNQNSGYRLAATGAIKDTAIELQDIAFYLSDFLLKHYPQQLVDRYQLNITPASEIEFLELMGANRGCLRSGGHVDLEKASTILLNEYRAGKLGPITLETPDMIAVEEKIVAKEIKEKAEREKLRKEKKHGSRKKHS